MSMWVNSTATQRILIFLMSLDENRRKSSMWYKAEKWVNITSCTVYVFLLRKGPCGPGFFPRTQASKVPLCDIDHSVHSGFSGGRGDAHILRWVPGTMVRSECSTTTSLFLEILIRSL